MFFFFKQKTAYDMRISDWSSDVCSSDLGHAGHPRRAGRQQQRPLGRPGRREADPDRPPRHRPGRRQGRGRRTRRRRGRRVALMAHTLILLRHGESEWNAKNLFTGWVDVALTEKGRGEAVRGGEQLKAAGLLPDVVHTSLQRRAINTAAMDLDAADRPGRPAQRPWRSAGRRGGEGWGGT